MAFGAAKIPKIREHAELTLSDGTHLVGHVFIDATSRIQDLLNATPRRASSRSSTTRTRSI